MPTRQRWFAGIFIFLALATPLAITWYVSTDEYQNRDDQRIQQNREAGVSSKSKISSGQLLLVKNEKIEIDKTSIVFKGLADNTVKMEIYLLELDPQVPYPLKFNKQSVSDGIWIGNVLYQLVSVKDNLLRLRIQDSYSTL